MGKRTYRVIATGGSLFLIWLVFSQLMYWHHTAKCSNAECCRLPLVSHGGTIASRALSVQCFSARQEMLNAHGQMGDIYQFNGPHASQQVIDQAYQQLKIADESFRAANMKYTIARGTLLAALRNGGLIPNDDDLDTSVEEGFDEVLFEKELNARGARLLRHPVVGFQIHLKDALAETHPLDVWSLRRNSNGKMDFSGFSARQRWPRSFVTTSAWDSDFEEVNFGHLKVMMMPSEEACQAMRRNYGSAVFTEAYKITNHIDHGQRLFTAAASLSKDPVCGDYYYIASSSDPRFSESCPDECLPKARREWRRVLTINIEQLVGIACLLILFVYASCSCAFYFKMASKTL